MHAEFYSKNKFEILVHLAGSEWDSILILLASCQQNLYDIYHCCFYSEKLLMMDRRTV